jgi:energy-coupling factor transport system permease protein
MKRLLDPRTKLLLLVLAAVYIGMQLSAPAEILLILIFLTPLFLAGLYKMALIFLGIYFIQFFAAIYLLPNISHSFLVFVVSFLVYGLRLLLPSIIIGAYAMKTTAVSEWIAAFKKIHMPNWLLIPLAVMARFFPTIREDYRHIRKAMAFRGIGTGFFDLVKHPMQTLEFILIPLLMNATQVSEDLAISSLTKGLSLPGKHTTIVHLEMTSLDWLFIGLSFIPMVLHLGGVI